MSIAPAATAVIVAYTGSGSNCALVLQPQFVILVLLDNGRTAVLADEIGRAALHKSHHRLMFGDCSDRGQLQPVVDHEGVPAGDHGRAAVARIVRRDDGGSPPRGLGQHPFACHRRRREVFVPDAWIVRAVQLDRAVCQVANEHRRLAGVEPYHRGSRGVARRRTKPKRLSELMVVGL